MFAVAFWLLRRCGCCGIVVAAVVWLLWWRGCCVVAIDALVWLLVAAVLCGLVMLWW